jgi:hypothetical protein
MSVQVIRCSEMSITTWATWRHIPDDGSFRNICRFRNVAPKKLKTIDGVYNNSHGDDDIDDGDICYVTFGWALCTLPLPDSNGHISPSELTRGMQPACFRQEERRLVPHELCVGSSVHCGPVPLLRSEPGPSADEEPTTNATGFRHQSIQHNASYSLYLHHRTGKCYCSEWTSCLQCESCQ